MDGATTEPSPPKSWVRQTSLALTEGVAVVLAGLGFAAYFDMSSRPGDIAAGAAFGLAIALGVGGLFGAKDHWELLVRLHGMSQALNQQKQVIIDGAKRRQRSDQLRAVNGFYLGYQLGTVATEFGDEPKEFFFIRALCQELNLPLWPDEWELLNSLPGDGAALNAILDMVRSRVHQSAPEEWRCFFELGLTVFWLTQRLESHQSIVAVRRELEALRGNDALSLDPRYLHSVELLLSVLPTTLTLPEPDRVALVRRVNGVLAALPAGEPSFRIAPFPTPITDWYWVQVGEIEGVAMRFIGNTSLTAYPGGRYELDSPTNAVRCVVRLEDSKWSCSAHSMANTAEPCGDIELVYDLTDGGQPVTKAGLRLVRSEVIRGGSDS